MRKFWKIRPFVRSASVRPFVRPEIIYGISDEILAGGAPAAPPAPHIELSWGVGAPQDTVGSQTPDAKVCLFGGCRKNGCLFIVAGDASLAVKLNADGLHLPEYLVLSRSLKAQLWRQKPYKILTAAAHCQTSLMTCMALPVDAALLSPVFPTNSHLNQTNLGVLKFQKLAKQTKVGVYALGGVNNKNAIRLIHSPAIGIAGNSAIHKHRIPR